MRLKSCVCATLDLITLYFDYQSTTGPKYFTITTKSVTRHFRMTNNYEPIKISYWLSATAVSANQIRVFPIEFPTVCVLFTQ
jgi:hypothetical protein